HATQLTERARYYLEASGFKFAENWCEPVVDVFAERLRVTGFDVRTDEDNAKQEAEFAGWLADLWERNRMDGVQGTVHTQSVMKSEAFVAVDYDEDKQRPRWTWNPAERCKAIYSEDRPDEVEMAVKVWSSSEAGPSNAMGARVARMNLYYPDRVEKYFRRHNSARGGWARWMDDGDEAWPVPWVDKQGAPLGVGLIHFRNKPLGSTRGRSRLRSVLPMQDEINKLVLDMNAIIDMQGYPQRYISTDADTSSFTVSPGEIWKIGPNDSAGQFAAADAVGVHDAIESTLSRLARRTRTPLHLLTGGAMPSGEALKSAEAGLVSGVREAMVGYGNAWEDVIGLGIRLTATFGTLPIAVDPSTIVISTQWDDPESRNIKEEAETAVIKRDLGVSKATLLTELGYDPEQEAERRALEADETAAALGSWMNGGAGMGGTAIPTGGTVMPMGTA
ncbi:MAG: phage portal protein, partial [Gemmatimonadaceae bacterium]|nr:phage portal protein [Gemmatimonadaceae bacterium]